MKAAVGIIGAGPAGLLSANLLVLAGIEYVVFECLSEEAVRARARAGLVEVRTTSLLDRHGLAEGMRSRGSTSGAYEFRWNGVRHAFDYAALTGSRHHVYPQQMLVADLLDALRSAGGEVVFNRPVKEVSGTEDPELRWDDGDSVR